MTFILDTENNDKASGNPVPGDKLLPSETDACSAAVSPWLLTPLPHL